MGRKILSKISLILITTIIILLIISLKNNFMIQNYPIKEIAALLSIIIGIFSFVKEKIFAKHTKFYKWIFQIVMILLSIIILVPKIYQLLFKINKFLDLIIIGIYILILLLVANITKNEKVSKAELRTTEMFLGKQNFNETKQEEILKKEKRKKRKLSKKEKQIEEFIELNSLKK